MSRDAVQSRWPVVACVLLALTLSILPLPGALEAFRPDWVALTLIYWSLTLPRGFGLVAAWLAGLALDVLQGTLLGQHALALTVTLYFPLQFHLRLRVFPVWQLAATVMALLALYQFILFWVNGITDVSAAAVHYWGPVLTGTLLWPPLMAFLDNMRMRFGP